MRFLLAMLLLTSAVAWADLTVGPKSPLIDLHCRASRLPEVLQQLAGRMRCNIMISPEVQGTVTADLTQVPAMQALGMVLKMQATPYRWKMVGNTIVVASPERLRRIPDDILDGH